MIPEFTSEQGVYNGCESNNAKRSFPSKGKQALIKTSMNKISKAVTVTRKNSEPLLKKKYLGINQVSKAFSLSASYISLSLSSQSSITNTKLSLLKGLSKSTSNLAVAASSNSLPSSTKHIGGKYNNKVTTPIAALGKKLFSRSKSGEFGSQKALSRNASTLIASSNNVSETCKGAKENGASECDKGKQYNLCGSQNITPVKYVYILR